MMARVGLEIGSMVPVALKVKMYYAIKPLLPRKAQISLRRGVIDRKRAEHFETWPIDDGAAQPPLWWQGWPGGKKFALVLTHDVERFEGQFACIRIAMLERSLGFRSAFYFVPERYRVLPRVRNHLTSYGHEVGVHDYNHDGKLFSNERVFNQRSESINGYLKKWGAHGFRSGAMHHNLKWISRLSIRYDCSTFDTDPFEPQPDGVRTIFPFTVYDPSSAKEYVEIPYTLPQDFTLFVLMREDGPITWKKKLDWIAEHGGMALVNVHPDYTNLDDRDDQVEQYPVRFYKEFLQYAEEKYGGEYWHALPNELAEYWMTLPREGNQRIIEDGGNT